MSPLFSILVCLVLAYLLSELCKYVGLPRVIGQITTGIILGIGAIKGMLFTDDALETISFLANLGIILLFYYVGLETNLKAFTKNVKKSLFVSAFNTLLPFTLGFAIMKFVFGLDTTVAIIVGATLSMSAQSVSVDMLEELKMLKSKLGNLIITIGAVDDILEITFLTGVLAVLHSAVVKVTPLQFFLDALIFIIVVILARLFFVPYTLRMFDREHSVTSRFMGSMIVVLLMASFSEFLGIGQLIGALVAGIIVRQTIFKTQDIPNWEQHSISHTTHVIAFGFLIPLFFVSVGLRTDFSAVQLDWVLTATLSIIAIAGTVLGTAIAVKLLKGSMHEGLLLGWGLNPKGDVDLVIITLALQYALITQEMFAAMVVMSLVTLIVSPVVFRLMLKGYKEDKKKAWI